MKSIETIKQVKVSRDFVVEHYESELTIASREYHQYQVSMGRNGFREHGFDIGWDIFFNALIEIVKHAA